MGIQWLGSFAVFFYPGAPQNVRAAFAPYHVGIGLAVVGMVVATVESGILEKLTFNGSCNVNGELNGEAVRGYMAPDCVTGNILGLLVILALIALVVTIWHAKHSEQSMPLNDETTPLLLSGAGDEQHEALV